VRFVATRRLLTSFRGVVPPSLVAFPRVVAACASANARPTTCILDGACSPRTLEPRSPPGHARVQVVRKLHPATPSRLLLEVPSIGAPYRTSTPGHLAETRHLRPRGATRMGPVPPSWFLTTSTISSVRTVRTLLQSAADPGVHRISRPLRLIARSRRRRSSQRGRSPRCTHPSKVLPVCSACFLTMTPRRASCTRSPLPPCRFGDGAGVDPSARTHSGPTCVTPFLDRLRGFVLQTGLLSSSTVSSGRRRCPSMGFCSPSDHRIPLAADCGPRSSSLPKQPILERITSKNGTEVPSPR
jgi:hypothetical protein